MFRELEPYSENSLTKHYLKRNNDLGWYDTVPNLIGRDNIFIYNGISHIDCSFLYQFVVPICDLKNIITRQSVGCVTFQRNNIIMKFKYMTNSITSSGDCGACCWIHSHVLTNKMKQRILDSGNFNNGVYDGTLFME